MSWSLMNHIIAEKVDSLVEGQTKSYAPEVERSMSREICLSVIHAALWAHGARGDSMAGAYAHLNLYNALGLKGWTFDDEEQALLVAHRTKRADEQRAAYLASRSAATGTEAGTAETHSGSVHEGPVR